MNACGKLNPQLEILILLGGEEESSHIFTSISRPGHSAFSMSIQELTSKNYFLDFFTGWGSVTYRMGSEQGLCKITRQIKQCQKL